MWPNPQFPEDLVIFTGEIFNGKLLFFFAVETHPPGYSVGRDCISFCQWHWQKDREMKNKKFSKTTTYATSYIIPMSFWSQIL